MQALSKARSKIAEELREGRIKKHLTQEELGALVGISGKTVSDYERGRTTPDFLTLRSLCDNLGMLLSDL